MRRAVCPGSFDPVTNGHIDVIQRAVKVFDEVVVAVSGSPSNLSKRAMFTLEERIQMIEEVTPEIPNLKIVSFTGLLVDLVRELGADCVVKGIRAVSDFDYEMQMAQMNHQMGVETVFLPTSAEHSYLSSSLMKEVISLGGDISGLVPASVEVRLKEKLGR